MEIEVTNNSRAPQGITRIDGKAVFIKPGETRCVDVDEIVFDRVTGLPFFHVTGALKPRKLAPGEMLEEGNIPEGVYLGEVDDALAANGKGADFDGMTDDELADAYEARTGNKPHHRAKRETIIAKLREA